MLFKRFKILIMNYLIIIISLVKVRSYLKNLNEKKCITILRRNF